MFNYLYWCDVSCRCTIVLYNDTWRNWETNTKSANPLVPERRLNYVFSEKSLSKILYSNSWTQHPNSFSLLIFIPLVWFGILIFFLVSPTFAFPLLLFFFSAFLSSSTFFPFSPFSVFLLCTSFFLLCQFSLLLSRFSFSFSFPLFQFSFLCFILSFCLITSFLFSYSPFFFLFEYFVVF